jgi:hypothetical protein
MIRENASDRVWEPAQTPQEFVNRQYLCLVVEIVQFVWYLIEQAKQQTMMISLMCGWRLNGLERV